MPSKKGTSKVSKRFTAEQSQLLLKPFLQETDADFSTGSVNTVEAGLRVDTVLTCIKRISDMTAKTGVHVFEVQEDGSKERARDHAVSRLLTRRVNPDMTANTWKHFACVQMLGWGNSFSLINRDNSGAVVGFTPFHTDDIHVEGRAASTGELVFGWTDKEHKTHLFPARDILHFKGMTFDGIMGISPILQLRQLIGRARERDEYLARFYRNNAQLGGVLRLKDGLTQEQLDRSRASFESTYKGARNSGKILILEGVEEFHESVMSQKDQEFIETSKLDSAKIAAAFGVPLGLLNDVSNVNRANGEQMWIEFLATCLDPLFSALESEMNVKLFSEEEEDRFYVEFNRQSIIQADTATLIEALSKETQSMVLTPNEARARLGLNSIEGGDQLMVPVNFMPMDQIGMRSSNTFDFNLDPQPVDEPAEDATTETEESSTESQVRSSAPTQVRSKNNRKRIMKSAKTLLLDAYKRIGKRERQDLEKALGKKDRDAASFKRFIDDYYARNSSFVQYMRTTLTPIMTATANSLHDDVEDQLGRGVTDDPQFALDYIAALANRYALASHGQLESVLKELADDEDADDALLNRLDEWETGTSDENPSRADKESGRESNRFVNAFTRTLFIAGGVTKLVWNTSGGGCPICDELDGRTVGIDQSFVSEGDGFANNFKADSDYLHPPLHSGCNCEVNPA